MEYAGKGTRTPKPKATGFRPVVFTNFTIPACICWIKDLNLHTLRHWILKPACLPIPPIQQDHIHNILQPEPKGKKLHLIKQSFLHSLYHIFYNVPKSMVVCNFMVQSNPLIPSANSFLLIFTGASLSITTITDYLII